VPHAHLAQCAQSAARACYWTHNLQHPKKRKEKTTQAVTATVSDSTAGRKRQSKCKHKAQTPPAFSYKSKRQQNKSPAPSTKLRALGDPPGCVQ